LLQLRGAAPSASPLVHGASGCVLLFNGQIFGGSLSVPPLANDAQVLLQALSRPETDVPALLSGLRGPWALVFWQAAERILWFGRDPLGETFPGSAEAVHVHHAFLPVFWHAKLTVTLHTAGRRSLLLHLPRPQDGRLILTSTAPLDPAVRFEGFAELPPSLYSLDLAKRSASREPGSGSLASESGKQVSAAYRQHSWTDPEVQHLVQFRRAAELVEPTLEATIAADGRCASVQTADMADDAMQGGLQAPAVGLGLSSHRQPDAGVVAATAGPACQPINQLDQQNSELFEESVDAVLAALRQAVAVRCRCIEGRQEPGAQPTAAPCPRTAPGSRQPFDSSAGMHGRQADGMQSGSDRSDAAAANGSTSSSPVPPAALLPPAPLLVLFSGGVDSTLLALLAHESLPPEAPIDLASICFAGGTSPDRLAVLDALAELRAAAPGRRWRLILVSCWWCTCHAPVVLLMFCSMLASKATHAGGVHGSRGVAPTPAARRLQLPRRLTARLPTWRRRAPACCACWHQPTQ
jgi:hypothetical protein